MKKRILAMLLALALAAGLTPTAAALDYGEEHTGETTPQEQLYSDIPVGHWAYNATQTCSQRDWFNGYPDGTFRPNQKIKRAEAAKVFAQALGLENQWPQGCYPYTDIGTHWAKEYISAAVGLFPNVQNLRGTATFRPEQTITREEVVYALVVAWRYASLTRNADLSVLNMFDDADSISADIKPFMAVAVQNKLVSGFGDRTIRAQDGLTRAQFATLLYKALKHGFGPDDTSAPEIILDNYASVTTESSITVTGRVTPAIGTQVRYFNYDSEEGREYQTRPLYPEKDGRFQLELPLAEGENVFGVCVSGLYSAGYTTDYINVTRGGKENFIRILSTIPGETDQETLTFNGVIENYTSECSLLVDGKVTAVKEGGFFEVTLALEPGENDFTLSILRRGETVASQKVTVTRYDPEGEGEWLDGLPQGVTASRYNIETKTQYREKTRETVTDKASSLEGWTLVSTGGEYGAWSAWQKAAVTESSTRKVETRQTTTPAKTQYRYHRYENGAGSDYFVCAYLGLNYYSSMHLAYSNWVDTPYPEVKKGYVNYLVHPHQSGCERSGCLSTDPYEVHRHVAPDGKVWYYEETRQIPGETVTEYRYADFVPSNTFARWGDWSEWTDGEKTADENTQVEARTLYRFTKK